jgi:hypothetical protein
MSITTADDLESAPSRLLRMPPISAAGYVALADFLFNDWKVVKYGGSLLWAAMVFFLVAIATSHLSRMRVALTAAAIAIGGELFRLVHAPWLDAFRLTLPGALLLGRIFSLWNMLAYGVGIVLAIWLDRFVMGARLRSHAGAP